MLLQKALRPFATDFNEWIQRNPQFRSSSRAQSCRLCAGVSGRVSALFLTVCFLLLLLFCFSNAQQNFPCSERPAEQLIAGRRAESSNPSYAPDPPAANHPITSPISAIMTAKRAETARKARGAGRQLIRVNQAARCLRRGVTAPKTPRDQWARSHG